MTGGAGRTAPRPSAPQPVLGRSRWGRPRRWPWWAQVLAVHGLARVVGAVLLVVVARTQEANPWTGAAPGYLEYTGLMWDGAWYREIAEQGYPADLPTGPDGRVLQNAWAFFPLFPLLVRGLTGLTGAPWHVVGPLLATVLGAAAMLVVHRVVADGVDGSVAGRGRRTGEAGRTGAQVGLVAVAVLTTSAAAPVLQVAYTESLALLLLASVLWAVQRRQYLLAMPLVLALGLTRAVALPVAVAVLVHLLVRGRAAGPGGRRQMLPVLGLGLVAVAAGLLWPALVGLGTGDAATYARTQAAWRGTGEVVPVLPWLDVGRWLLGPWGLPALVVLVALAATVVLSGPMRRLGPELQAWTGGYLGYLLVVLEPGTSLLRFLLLAFPLAGAAAVWALDRSTRGRRRVAVATLMIVGLAGQVAWVALLWRLVPPSGWPP